MTLMCLTCLQLLISTMSAQMIPDLGRWYNESYTKIDGSEGEAGNWTPAPDGKSVLQTKNGDPTLFCSDFFAFNKVLQGEIQPEEEGMNDKIGFALGFNRNDTMNPDADYLLLDWQGEEDDGASEGLAISRVKGMPTADEFFTNTNNDSGEGLVLLQRGMNFGNTGWTAGTTYTFSFVFSPTELRVFLNGALEPELSITGHSIMAISASTTILKKMSATVASQLRQCHQLCLLLILLLTHQRRLQLPCPTMPN